MVQVCLAALMEDRLLHRRRQFECSDNQAAADLQTTFVVVVGTNQVVELPLFPLLAVWLSL